ncbi:hypothetical protein ABOM_011409 [Aspergillus bombycis]|uniref:Mucoidy inhibitor A n=1 Tax=Aspergillus bombycis TaxID=109264 RepID=A0A1F7ZKZ0_9EURO|nr:hypothetical protein ABOM_011409 [Aspergillus bombycis]OGM40092.1 hypothetical protein ABOM_011409 [Aspergillus bombycis]
MAEIPTSTIQITDLPTKSVTITPQRATIVREIRTSIQPGQHELKITGLDPQVNSDSLLIEGTGLATITDIQTSIVPRQEKFEDIYPLESDSDDSADPDSDSGDDDDDDPELRAISDEIADVETRLAKARNERAMALSMLEILDEYARKMDPESTGAEALEGFLALYTRQRTVGNQRCHQAGVEVGEGERELARLGKKRGKVEGRLRKAREAASKKERREREKRATERARRAEQRRMKRDERFKFWTGRVGQVVVHLDSQAGFTPGSSRRSSVVDRSEIMLEPVDVVLRLSYVVPGVSWSSRYELRINTPSSSARMAYRAEFRNSSSETWTDARVTLSTSQASFSGLEQRIPSLHPWHIKLLDAIRENQEHPSWEKILRGGYANRSVVKTSGLFGTRPSGTSQFGMATTQPQQGFGFAQFKPASANPFGAAPTQSQNSTGSPFSAAQPSTASAFGSPPNQNQPSSSRGLFGGLAPAAPASNQTGDTGEASGHTQKGSSGGLFGSGGPLFGRAAAAVPAQNPSEQEPNPIDHAHGEDYEGSEDEPDNDIDTVASTSLEHQESVKQDYGLTTTYDLPGQRTLTPSSNNRRHVLADLDLESVTLSHIIVPKHSAEAFYRARIKNTSSLRIMRGRVGLTVDGTFLGTATIPNCAPGDFFSVSLGVDPSILVTYGKPTVRRLNTGFFTGQVGAVFRRTCWIKNTKGVAADITVLDQVPVSEDKELQVEILEPKGLHEKGNEVKLDMEASHGSGKAVMEKKGEVKWVLHLEPGKDVRVVLEYGTKAPKGSEVDTA